MTHKLFSSIVIMALLLIIVRIPSPQISPAHAAEMELSVAKYDADNAYLPSNQDVKSDRTRYTEVSDYDLDKSSTIEKSEAVRALDDYLVYSRTDVGLLLEVINLFNIRLETAGIERASLPLKPVLTGGKFGYSGIPTIVGFPQGPKSYSIGSEDDEISLDFAIAQPGLWKATVTLDIVGTAVIKGEIRGEEYLQMCPSHRLNWTIYGLKSETLEPEFVAGERPEYYSVKHGLRSVIYFWLKEDEAARFEALRFTLERGDKSRRSIKESGDLNVQPAEFYTDTYAALQGYISIAPVKPIQTSFNEETEIQMEEDEIYLLAADLYILKPEPSEATGPLPSTPYSKAWFLGVTRDPQADSQSTIVLLGDEVVGEDTIYPYVYEGVYISDGLTFDTVHTYRIFPTLNTGTYQAIVTPMRQFSFSLLDQGYIQHLPLEAQTSQVETHTFEFGVSGVAVPQYYYVAELTQVDTGPFQDDGCCGEFFICSNAIAVQPEPAPSIRISGPPISILNCTSRYVITVSAHKNAGIDQGKVVTITTSDIGVDYTVELQSSEGQIAQINPSLWTWTLGTLEPNDCTTLHVDILPTSVTCGGSQVSITATLEGAYGSPADIKTFPTDISQPILILTQTGLPDVDLAHGVLEYVTAVENVGNARALDLTVATTINATANGANWQDVNAIVSRGTFAANQIGGFDWSLQSLDPGQRATLTIQLLPNSVGEISVMSMVLNDVVVAGSPSSVTTTVRVDVGDATEVWCETLAYPGSEAIRVWEGSSKSIYPGMPIFAMPYLDLRQYEALAFTVTLLEDDEPSHPWYEDFVTMWPLMKDLAKSMISLVKGDLVGFVSNVVSFVSEANSLEIPRADEDDWHGTGYLVTIDDCDFGLYVVTDPYGHELYGSSQMEHVGLCDSSDVCIQKTGQMPGLNAPETWMKAMVKLQKIPAPIVEEMEVELVEFSLADLMDHTKDLPAEIYIESGSRRFPQDEYSYYYVWDYESNVVNETLYRPPGGVKPFEFVNLTFMEADGGGDRQWVATVSGTHYLWDLYCLSPRSGTEDSTFYEEGDWNVQEVTLTDVGHLASVTYRVKAKFWDFD